MSARPLWRWWLFCAALWLYGRIGRRGNAVALDVMGWSVLPEWVAGPEEIAACASRDEEGADVPF